METLPYNTPTTSVFNTRMPVAWYQYLLRKATARNMTVNGLVKATIRELASVEDEQRMALRDGISITAVRQRLLLEAYPDLPKWDSGVSRMRVNTPVPADLTHKPENRDKPRTFSLQVPMSQGMYYGIKRLAAERQMEPEEFARKVLSMGYKNLAAVLNVTEADSDD